MKVNLCESVFALAGAAWTLRFSAQVVDTISRCVQRRWYSKERVGQLFSSDLTTNEVVIEVATVLKPAWATWTGVQFRRQEAVEQRAALLGQGLHCVGFWHTHPEPECRPSPTDAQLAADHADAAKATLNGLVFVIASNRPAFLGWYVAIHDGTKFHRTIPVASTEDLASPDSGANA